MGQAPRPLWTQLPRWSARGPDRALLKGPGRGCLRVVGQGRFPGQVWVDPSLGKGGYSLWVIFPGDTGDLSPPHQLWPCLSPVCLGRHFRAAPQVSAWSLCWWDRGRPGGQVGGPAASRAPGTLSPPGYLWSGTSWESEKLHYLLHFPPEIELPQSPLVLPSSRPLAPQEMGGHCCRAEATRRDRNESEWTQRQARSKGAPRVL